MTLVYLCISVGDSYDEDKDSSISSFDTVGRWRFCLTFYGVFSISHVNYSDTLLAHLSTKGSEFCDHPMSVVHGM